MPVVDDFISTVSGLLNQSAYKWGLMILALLALTYAWNAVMSFIKGAA